MKFGVEEIKHLYVTRFYIHDNNKLDYALFYISIVSGIISIYSESFGVDRTLALDKMIRIRQQLLYV